MGVGVLTVANAMVRHVSHEITGGFLFSKLFYSEAMGT